MFDKDDKLVQNGLKTPEKLLDIKSSKWICKGNTYE